MKDIFDLMKDANRLGNAGNLKELKFIANRIPTFPWEGKVSGLWWIGIIYSCVERNVVLQVQ